MKFKIPYYLRNNGDGSASVVICSSIEEAKKKDESQSEGWGEESCEYITVNVDEQHKTLKIDGYKSNFVFNEIL